MKFLADLDRACVAISCIVIVAGCVVIPVSHAVAGTGSQFAASFAVALVLSLALQTGRSSAGLALSLAGNSGVVACCIAHSLTDSMVVFYATAGLLALMALVIQASFLWLFMI